MTSVRSAFFKSQGYLILPDFISELECDRLRRQMDILLSKANAEDPSIFSTRNCQHTQSERFFRSSKSIEYFFEEDAFDEKGDLIYPVSKAINKVGHALHQKDAVFCEFSWDKRFLELAREFSHMKTPHIVQSMYIFKQARIGGEVSCHQDGSFLDTTPSSLLGLWLALEDADEENGCLWGIPYDGEEPLRKKFVCDPHNNTSMQTLDERAFAMEKLIPLPVTKGSLILLDGNFAHLSYANRSGKTRHAYSLHIIDKNLHYPETNWLKFDPYCPWLH